MRLSEEYLKRHGIDVPLVRHVQAGSLFLRNDSEDRTSWELLKITGDEDRPPNDRSGPNMYLIERTRPILNGFEKGVLFETLDEQRVEWDHYEDHLLAYANRPGQLRAIKDSAEIYLVAWEMFVYNHDHVLSPYANNNSFFASVDSTLSLGERHKGYSDFTRNLALSPPQFFSDWSREMLQHVRIYCHWLAKIMDGAGASNKETISR